MINLTIEQVIHVFDMVFNSNRQQNSNTLMNRKNNLNIYFENYETRIKY